MGKLVVTFCAQFRREDADLVSSRGETTEVITTGVSASQEGSETQPHKDGVVILTAHGADIWAKIGEAPTAAEGDGFLVKQNERLRLACRYGDKVAGLDDSSL